MRLTAAVAAVVAVVVSVGCGPSAPSRRATPPDPSTSLSPSTRPVAPPPSTVLGTTVAQPSTTTRPDRAPAAEARWVVGAHPLPLNADGTARVEPTPPALVDRQLPTTDLLPPPPDGRFHSTIGPITTTIRERMGTTWHPGCPVPLAQLRYLTVSFRGFDHAAHTGELVVNASVAAAVVTAFRSIFAAGFPIEEMRLVTTADLDAAPTGDGNDTAGFVCRPTRGSTVWSAHAYGLAIDIDPFQNPYSTGAEVLPELASSYLDRSDVRPGMILPGGPVVRAFAAIGWTWGGTWRNPVDRMHVTATGR